ncbi:acyltransferase ChoActase/COT/CPT [Pleurotus eryngii]|uniref:Acyltransferase ChoActase/COT/CPT n=1 Tax=Pleurotus eryngii TaxID=5323 RepID=A0A9P6D898_PLEER|nr:acyltransferase ChoActase/COT/CPT [Pleurotus eryngii]
MRTKTGGASSGTFNNLPRLPVPPLRKTLDRYLKSIEPFLLEDEAKGGQPFYEALALRTKWADEFERGIGTVCQERLLALDKQSPHNWLDDNFWLDKAYMEWRAPLVVNSNWWLVFAHDKGIPQPQINGTNGTGITPWQVRRAAWLVHRTLQYKDTIAATASSDNTRTGIWLRENIARVFNVCRIPQLQRDVLAPPPPPSSVATRCIVVTVHNWFYLVEAFVDQELLPVSALEQKLRAVVRDARQRLQRGEKAPLIGALSADERDKWAANLSRLLSVSEQNRRTHESIVHSLMGLSLDDTTHFLRRSPDNLPPPLGSASSSFDPTHPSQLELDAHLHTIRSTTTNVSNRFFDKAYTIIVDPSARAGATGEHSPVDALVPSIVGEYSVVQDIDQGMFSDTLPSDVESTWFDNDTDSNGWSRLNWDTDAYIEKECNEAAARAKLFIEDSDDSVLWFRDYGTDWIKTVAQMAPDAFIQQALQLAWYRTRGSFTATYETTLTRMFKHGRTETIRTHTNDSRAWVLAMMDPRSPVREPFRTCATLLHKAIAAHTSLTREAATGRGIDRHLMGLQLLLKPDDGEQSELFSDDIFQRSTSWKLSTSGLSAGYLFRGTGFGAQYDDGYGINYLAAADQIKFGIESKYASPLTSTALFQTAVINSLHEMKLLFEPEHQLTSHL